MAMIRKRGDYQYQAVIRRKGWPQQSKTFNTLKEAERWARGVEHEMDRGIYVSRFESENTTLFEALDRYAKEVSPLKKGHIRELGRIKKLQSTNLANRYLATLRSADFAEFRDQKRAEGKAENTIRLDLALLSHLFNTARKDWGMENLANPVLNIKMPSGSNQRTRRLKNNEEKELFDELKKCRNKFIAPAVIFAIETGCRRGELLKLIWENVDLENQLALLTDTKNGESRTIPLSPLAIETLKQLKSENQSGKVFLVTADGLSRAFARCRNSLGIDDLKLHDLRHEATSRLFEKGLNTLEVATISGHKTLQMLKRYTHLRPADIAKKLGWKNENLALS